MSIFRVVGGTSPLDVVGGVPINLLNTITWIERYQEYGEFTVTAPLYSGMIDALPIGSIVGHEGRLELMVVENHEVVESGTEDPVVTVTGRSLDSIMEHRIVGAGDQSLSEDILVYQVGSIVGFYAHEAARQLLRDQIGATAAADDAVPNVQVTTSVTGGTLYTDPRTYASNEPVAVPIKSLMVMDDFGLKVIRPHTFQSLWPSSALVTFDFHKGVDRSTEVSFSYQQGDIEQANYFWSQGKNTNAVMVNSTYLSVQVDSGETGFARRFKYLDASDLDAREGTAPTGATKTAILAQMTERANDELAKNGGVTLVEVDISRSAAYIYEQHYAIGDLVNVHANYGVSQKMRVVEYASIFDKTGSSGFPTLSAI